MITTIGCGGDQNPNPRGSLNMAKDHGEALADEFDRPPESDLRTVTGFPFTHYRSVLLNFDEVPSAGD